MAYEPCLDEREDLAQPLRRHPAVELEPEHGGEKEIERYEPRLHRHRCQEEGMQASEAQWLGLPARSTWVRLQAQEFQAGAVWRADRQLR